MNYNVAEYRAGALLIFNLLALTGLLLRRNWSYALGYAVAAAFVQRKVAAGFQNTHWHSLEGKTAVITGANAGIGYITAYEMAKRGCHIVFACRSPQRAQDAMDKLQKEVPGAKLTFVPVDLSSLKSVVQFSDKIEALLKNGQLPALDFLINNGGGYWPPGTPATEDGFDMHIGTNHLGPVLLTERLLPYVVQCTGRVICLSSIAHTWTTRMDYSKPLPYHHRLLLVAERKPRAPQYALSKLCNLFHALHLAKRLEGTGVQCCSVHPGGVMTEVFRNLPAPLLKFMKMTSLMYMKTPEEGAQTTLHCVFAPKLVPGAFYCDCAPRNDVWKIQFDPKDVEAVMEWSFDALGLSHPCPSLTSH